MNSPDDKLVARKVVGALDRSIEKIDAGTLARLGAARRFALSRHRERPAVVWGLAWAVNAASPLAAYRQYGTRYLIAVCAFVLAIAGVAYWHTSAPVTDFAEIDLNLLTDDLPINAYLDSGFDSWLKRSSR